MPIYEYRCQACDLKFEVKRSFSEGPGADCPQCRCQAQRIFSPVPIVFKGPGFYVTDHASDGRSGLSGEKKDAEQPARVPETEPAGSKTVEKPSEAQAAEPKPAEVKA